MTDQVAHKPNSYFIFFSLLFLGGLVGAITSSLYWLGIIPFVILFFYLGWQCKELIFYALIFSLPWSIEYSFNSSLGTDLPDEPLMWLTTILFLAYAVTLPPASRARFRHPLLSLLLIYYGWAIITVPFSTDWLISLKFVMAKGWYLIAFVLASLFVFENKPAIKRTALLFLFSMVVVCIIAITRHATYGFKFANVTNSVTPFFRNHVNYSAMLVCSVPVLIAAFQVQRKYRGPLIAASIIVLVGLFFSYARGAWLALVVGLFAYWLIKKQKLFLAFVLSLLIACFLVFWLKSNDRYLRYAHDYKTTIFHKDFEEHLVATYRLKDVSTAERFNRWIAGVRMAADNWQLGYGPNTFYYNYKPYALPAFKTWVSSNKEHSTVHNYFLLVLIEQGMPGLLFFLAIAGGMLYYSERLYKRLQDKFYRATALACGVMVTMIIVVNFLSDLIETDKIGSLFFLCLATLVSIDLQTKNEREVRNAF